MKYYVTVRIEEQIECDVYSEAEAIKYALQFFDPTVHDPEIIEIWSEDD